MKHGNKILAILLAACLFIGLVPLTALPAAAAVPSEGFAANTLTREQMELLVQQTALAYFYKGSAVQYDSYYLTEGARFKGSVLRQTNNRDPEDASDLNPIYTVCSAFPHDVYYSIFGKHIITNALARPSADLSNAGIDMSDYVPNDARNNYAEAIQNVTFEYCYHAAMAAKNNPSWDLGDPDRDMTNFDPSSPYADVAFYFGPEMQVSGAVQMTATLKSGGTQRLYTIKNGAATVASSIEARAKDASGAALTSASSYLTLNDENSATINVQIKVGSHTEQQTVTDDSGNESTIDVEVDDFITYYAVGSYDTEAGTAYYYVSDADYNVGTVNPISALTRADVEKLFAEKVRPGDILVVRLAGSADADDSASGHAMMYLGDVDGDGVGEIIHSWGSKYNNNKGRTEDASKSYIKTGTYSSATSQDYYSADGTMYMYYGSQNAYKTSSASGSYLQGYDLRESPRGWYSANSSYGNNYDGRSGAAFVGRNGGGTIIIEDWTTRLGWNQAFSSYSSKVNTSGTYGSNYFKLKTTGNSGNYYPGGDSVGMSSVAFQFAVLRPLNKAAFTAQLSPSAQARRTLPDLGVTKTCDRLPTWTVIPNDSTGTLTYTVELVGNKAKGSINDGRTTTTISNFGTAYDSTSTYTVNVTEQLPSHTTFVSATGGGTYNSSTGEITWTGVSVANGAKVSLSYTVEANGAMGDVIVSPKGKVTSGTGYLSTSEIRHIIHGGGMTTAQYNAIKAPSISSTGSDIDIANDVYQAAGIDLTLPSISAMIDNLFRPDYWLQESSSNRERYRFCDASELTGSAKTLRNMVIQNYVGGKMVETYDENGRKTNTNRLRDLSVEFLRVGDILVFANRDTATGFFSDTKCYVYIGSNNFAWYNPSSGAYETVDGKMKLVQYSTGNVRFTYSPVISQTFLYDCFFALRPIQGVQSLKNTTCDLSDLVAVPAVTMTKDGGAPVAYGTLTAAARIETNETRAAQAGKSTYVITLQKDLETSSTPSFYGNVTLDLNGHTIRVSGKAYLNMLGNTSDNTAGVAYIRNGTIIGDYAAIYLGNQQELHVENCTIYARDMGGTSYRPSSNYFWGHAIAKASAPVLYLNACTLGVLGNEKPIYNGSPGGTSYDGGGTGSGSNDAYIHIVNNVTFYVPTTFNEGENRHSGWAKDGSRMTVDTADVVRSVTTETLTLPVEGAAEKEYNVVRFTTGEASIGGVKYATLDAALTAAEAAGTPKTVTLLGDLQLTGDITVPANVTLDPGAYALTGGKIYLEPGATYASVTAPVGADALTLGGSTHALFLPEPDMTVQQSLSLTDTIVLNAAVDDGGYTGYYAWMRWSEGGTPHTAVVPGESSGATIYFPLVEKKAKNMGDLHDVTIFAVDASGEVHVARSTTLSIKDYADAVLDGYVDWEHDTNDAATGGRYGANLGRAMIAMLQYGAAAQTNFGYETGSLVTADLTPAMEAKITAKYGEDVLAAARGETRSGVVGSKGLFYGTSSILGENMALKFYFRLPPSVWTNEALAAVTVKTDYTDHLGVKHENTFSAAALDPNSNENFRSCTIGSLTAADIAAPVTVTLIRDGKQLMQVWDSIANYTGRAKAAGMTALADPMLIYGLAARDYFPYVAPTGDAPTPEEFDELEILIFD
ncbi:MAG: hypothetical protein IJT18_05415 [Oscillospiraceae bacterium]|nr:hypothetical protein [Oscillospiraceae bacterium]